MRKGKRVRVAKYIYRDDTGLEAVARVRNRRESKRFPLGTPLGEMQQWQREVTLKLGRMADSPMGSGTFEGDVARYLKLVAHLASAKARRHELHAWLRAFQPQTKRQLVTIRQIVAIHSQWLQQGVAPKTINNRTQTLRHLYRLLDGPDAPNLLDNIPPLMVTRTPPIVIAPSLIQQVDAELQRKEQIKDLPNAKTRARFRILATTGRRPVEVMRAQPSDVDFERRVWYVRDAKGGYTPGLYLNDEMLASWKLFAEANAWGHYDTNSFARTLRQSGWPPGVKPYQLRHTIGITLSEQGVDLSDVQAQLGHKHLSTTRTHYVPVLNSRMQRISEQLDHRFGWSGVPPVGANKVPNGDEQE